MTAQYPADPSLNQGLRELRGRAPTEPGGAALIRRAPDREPLPPPVRGPPSCVIMWAAAPEARREEPMSAYSSFLRILRNKFIAGLIILIPIVITAKTLWWLFRYVDGLARPLTQTLAGREIHGAGFALTVTVVLVTGLLFSAGPLRRLLDGLVEVLESVPMVGTVYGTIRKVLAGFGSPESRQAFQRFVLVRRGPSLSPAFLTGSVTLERKDGTVQSLQTVYVPTNHLYLGSILVLPAEDVIPTDISVEDGVSLVLSAGASIPSRVAER